MAIVIPDLRRPTLAAMGSLPVIDLSGLDHGPDGTRSVARAIDAACRQSGFFLVVGHGVDPVLRHRLDVMARAFFALPAEVKGRPRCRR